jgi:hypothetical protein
MSEDKRYNGWANYETWAVNLWLGNEQSSDQYWRDVAAEVVAAVDDVPQVAEKVWTPREACRITLADRMKAEHENGKPELSGMWGDLLSAALSEVVWAEIALGYLEGTDYDSLSIPAGEQVWVKPTHERRRTEYPAANWLTERTLVTLKADAVPGSLDVVDVELVNGGKPGDDYSVYGFNVDEK